MRILVVSDTHGNKEGICKAHQLVQPIDLVIHCGDGEADTWLLESIVSTPVIRVAGNCDFESSAAKELLHEVCGRKILICHGDRYGVKSGLSRLAARGREVAADVVLFGHTHQALLDDNHGLLLLNPGTLYQLVALKTFALLEIGKKELKGELLPLSPDHQAETLRDFMPNRCRINL